jgi:hypothetical protein
MKTKLISLIVLIVFGIVTLITCKKKDILPPVANAGPDQVLSLPTDSILLDGSASSNPNGAIGKWQWTKIAGPATFTISNSAAAITKVKNLVEGIYKFELKVTNNNNLSAIDEIVITVIAQPNQGPALPPVADAGADTTIKLVSCGSKGSATLDGSRSYDSGNNITGYLWSQISGPTAATLASPVSSITKADNLSTGQYVFQFQVLNAKGLSAKDTVKVTVDAAQTTGSDLDLTISGNFTFMNNYEDCYYYPCSYYDYTTIEADFNFPSFGQFHFWSYESADTASASDAHYTYMSLYSTNNNGNGQRVGGQSSINLKKIIQNGGGAFSGTLKIDQGSATNCTPNIYTSLDPLTVTGSIDTAARTISLTIKGKTYF